MYQRKCKQCSIVFEIPATFRGRHPVHCGKSCREKHQKALREKRCADRPTCEVDGCSRKVTLRVGHGLCEACYMRLYRKGSSDLPKRKGRKQTSNGYLVVLRPEHPLARENDG